MTGYTTFILILKEYFSDPEVPADFHSVAAIFRTWQSLHGVLKEQYFLLPGEDMDDDIESSQMDVLIANPHGIFGVAEHRSVQEFSRFYAYGSGSDMAMGAMHALYNSQLSAEEIARRAIEAVAEFDVPHRLAGGSENHPAVGSLTCHRLTSFRKWTSRKCAMPWN